MTEFVLKKDTPFYKKGTKFSEDSLRRGVILNDDCLPVANINELDNPGEWFDMVDDKQLTDDATIDKFTNKLEDQVSKQCKAQIRTIR